MWLLWLGVSLLVISAIALIIMDVRWSISTVIRYNMADKQVERLGVVSSGYSKREATELLASGNIMKDVYIGPSKDNGDYSLSELKVEESQLFNKQPAPAPSSLTEEEEMAIASQEGKTGIMINNRFSQGEKAVSISEDTENFSNKNNVKFDVTLHFKAQ